MVFYIIDPQTKQKIKHNSNQYQKLVDIGVIKKNQYIVENIILPFTLPDGTTLTKFLAQGNRPVYETSDPDIVVKIGFPDNSTLFAEQLFRSTLENTEICPIYYHFGHFKIGRSIEQFPYLVMERMDKTLSKINDTEFLQVFDNLCEILDYFGKLPNHLDSNGYAYNDFKPENIMFNKRTGRWMLIDLETFTTIGKNKIPEFTAIYAPTNLLLELMKIGQRNEIYTTQFTDLECLVYTLYKAYYGSLPWSEHKHSYSKIVEARQTFLQKPTSKIDNLLKTLYNFSLTKQKENSVELLNADALKKMARDFLK